MLRNERFLEEWSIGFLWSFGEGMVVEDVLMSVSVVMLWVVKEDLVKMDE
jgi:hypothetical protein